MNIKSENLVIYHIELLFELINVLKKDCLEQ